MSSYYSSSPRSVSSVLSIEFRQVGRLRRVAMSGCQRCLVCGCLAVSYVLCADVWLSAMSCVRMSGCQRCLVCGCLAVSDVLCADVWLSAMSCVRMSGCQRCLVCGCHCNYTWLLWNIQSSRVQHNIQNINFDTQIDEFGQLGSAL